MPANRARHLPGVWLLDLTVGGRVYRFATEAVEVEDAAGRTYVYAEGLTDPGVSYGATAGVGDASVNIEIVSDVDWALLFARGHALDRCPAVLRRWWEGRTLERCRVVLRGLTSEPSVGAKGEPFALAIVRSMREQTRMYPPPSAMVHETTWPVTMGYVSPEKAQGNTYTLVIGCPGDAGEAEPRMVVPVPQAEHDDIASDGRLVWLGGDAVQVKVSEGENNQPVTTMTDDLGRKVQTCETGAQFIDDAQYFIGFKNDPAWGGGLVYEGELLRGAGDVINWVLREFYSGPVDFGRVDVARPFLNQWQIDSYIDTPVNMWEWLTKEVLSLLPVEMREGERGIYPAILRYNLTARDAVAHLDATRGSGRVEREGPFTLLADIVNEILVEYQPLNASTWADRRLLTGQDSPIPDEIVDPVGETWTPAVFSFLCAQSQQRYGVISLSLKAGAVWDNATAVLTAQHVAARQAWPRRAVRYSGGPWLEDIEIGQAVTLTDPELHLVDAVALVADVTPEGAGTLLDLVILDHPAMLARATS